MTLDSLANLIHEALRVLSIVTEYRLEPARLVAPNDMLRIERIAIDLSLNINDRFVRIDECTNWRKMSRMYRRCYNAFLFGERRLIRGLWLVNGNASRLRKFAKIRRRVTRVRRFRLRLGGRRVDPVRRGADVLQMCCGLSL